MSEWTFDGEVWSRPVGDGSVTVDIYPDELVGFPPLVEARAEVERLGEMVDRDRLMYEEHYVERLTVERDRLLAIVARLCHATEWWEATADDPSPVWERMELDGWDDATDTVATEPMAAIDAGLIRWALGIDDEQDERETI